MWARNYIQVYKYRLRMGYCFHTVINKSFTNQSFHTLSNKLKIQNSFYQLYRKKRRNLEKR